MSADDPSDAATDDKKSNRKSWIVVGVFAVVFFFFIQDVLGAINGGGIFSVTSAFHDATFKTNTIDVDGAGLRSVFLDAAIIVGITVCAALNVNIGSRWQSTVIIFAIVGSGFIADAYFDEPIITHLLTNGGYRRCEARDHHVGNGKSKVWFHNYVLRVADCPKRDL